jgi:hypothetical protein
MGIFMFGMLLCLNGTTSVRLLDLKDHKGLKASKGNRVHRGCKEFQVSRAPRESKEFKVLKARKEYKVSLERMGPMEYCHLVPC